MAGMLLFDKYVGQSKERIDEGQDERHNDRESALMVVSLFLCRILHLDWSQITAEDARY